MFPARFELATFRVWGGRDNHYTTETTVTNYCTVLMIYEINHLWTQNEMKWKWRKDRCSERSLRRSFLHFHFFSAVHIWFISYIINTHFFHSGFIAQLVEHRTCNHEVTGSNPVEVLHCFFLQASLRNCLNCVHCDDYFFTFFSNSLLFICFLCFESI